MKILLTVYVLKSDYKKKKNKVNAFLINEKCILDGKIIPLQRVESSKGFQVLKGRTLDYDISIPLVPFFVRIPDDRRDFFLLRSKRIKIGRICILKPRKEAK